MKDVCADCKFEKPGNQHFCKKYGIPIWKKRIYCVSKEPEGSEEFAKHVDEVPFTENESGRDHV